MQAVKSRHLSRPPTADAKAIFPPIVCRYPFANDEIAAFGDDVEVERAAKAKEVATAAKRELGAVLRPPAFPSASRAGGRGRGARESL